MPVSVGHQDIRVNETRAQEENEYLQNMDGFAGKRHVAEFDFGNQTYGTCGGLGCGHDDFHGGWNPCAAMPVAARRVLHLMLPDLTPYAMARLYAGRKLQLPHTTPAASGEPLTTYCF